MMSKKGLTTAAGAPVVDNNNVITAGKRGQMLMQDVWYLEKLAHFNREGIPERRMNAKGSGAYGTFTFTDDITQYTRAKIFSDIGKKTDMFVRLSTVAGERGADDADVFFAWRRISATPCIACSAFRLIESLPRNCCG